MTADKYYIYKYAAENSTWNLFKPNVQAKQVRFDRIGKLYYLGIDNCTYTDGGVKMLCGVGDFEVTAD